jgi:hypothetical protein
MQAKTTSILTIQKWVRGWRLRLKLKRELYELLKVNNQESLLISFEELRQRRAVDTISKHWSEMKNLKSRDRMLWHAVLAV